MPILDTDGASIYYEAAGNGPLLLLIPGGSGDAAGYAQIVGPLADRWTVVSYDRRGFSRSPLTRPLADADRPAADRLAADRLAADRPAADRLAADVEDAAALIGALSGDGTAVVFGSSSGAIVALHLLLAYPQRIERVIAHEPPLAGLLPEAEGWTAFLDEVHETYRRHGPDVASEFFGARLGMAGGALPDPEGLPPHLAELIGRLRANQRFWFEHEVRQYPAAVPDLDALAANRDKLVLAGGADSREFMPYRPNLVIAERLGSTVIDMPGGHIGYVTAPGEFARALAGVAAREPVGACENGRRTGK